MPHRRILLIIALAAFLILLGAALWLLLSNRNRAGETLTEVAGTPQPLLPTVLATAAGPEPAASGRETATTPSPTPAIVDRPGEPAAGRDLSLDALPTLKELVARYPELGDLLENVDLADRAQLSAAYEQLVALFAAEGAEGLRVFVSESGILQSLNIDPTYVDFVLAYETGGIAGAAALARQRRLLTEDGLVRIVLVLDTEDLSVVEPQLAAAGAVVLDHYGNEVEIGLPLSQIEAAASSEEALAQLVAIAHLPHVIAVRAPEQIPTGAWLPAGQGAALTLATEWHAAGITGRGVRVGIIDPDGFGGYQNLLGQALPPAERVILAPWLTADELNTATGPHGAACAEIIHAMAPDAELYLAYSGGSARGLAQAVDWLIASGVDIISYSASSIAEPLDGTGPSDEIAAVAQDAGILWVNASGNYAQSHLEMVFTDGDGDGYHEFPDGNELLPIYVAEFTSLGLTWDDNWNGASEDYDLYLMTPTADGRDLETIATSYSLQAGRAGDQPVEAIDIELSPAREYYVAIREDGISRPGRLNLLGWNNEFEYAMPEGSLGSPADAPGVLAVGATYWRDDVLEPYSSQGPTSDGRTKPELTAPTGVDSLSYGEFSGTSAAAPHVAGAAALVLSAFPDLDARQLRDYLTSRALDRGPAGFDNGYGAGRLALQQPPAVRAAPVTAAATIHAVRQSHNESMGGRYGVRLFVDFSVEGLRGQTGAVTARFSDAAGQPLADGNGQFSDGAGHVAVAEPFSPAVDSADISEFPLFMPYDELELPPGEHTVQVVVDVAGSDGAALAFSQPAAFILTMADDSQRLAEVRAVDVVHNVAHDNVAGMDILIDFDTFNFRGETGTLAAYFYFDDANNTSLLDFNDQYRAQDGVVAVGGRFQPGSNRAIYQDFALFMPYAELHMAEGARYNLKLQIVIWDEATGETLTVSEWVPFWFET